MIGQDIVFAGQPPDGEKPVLDPLQRAGVEVQILQAIGDPAIRLTEGIERPGKGLKRGIKAALGGLCRILEPPYRVRDLCFRTLPRHRLMGPGDVFTDFLRALHKAALAVEFGFLTGLGVQGVKLGHGMAQEVLFRPKRLELRCGPRRWRRWRRASLARPLAMV